MAIEIKVSETLISGTASGHPSAVEIELVIATVDAAIKKAKIKRAEIRSSLLEEGWLRDLGSPKPSRRSKRPKK